jgi:helix-turn-helix protein
MIGMVSSELKRIAAQYKKGMAIRAIAAAGGWSYGYTHARLHQAAASGLVTIRSRGARPKLVNAR